MLYRSRPPIDSHVNNLHFIHSTDICVLGPGRQPLTTANATRSGVPLWGYIGVLWLLGNPTCFGELLPTAQCKSLMTSTRSNMGFPKIRGTSSIRTTIYIYIYICIFWEGGSKLLASPLQTPIILPFPICSITHFKEFRL